MFASHVTGGRSGVFTCDGGEGAVIGGANSIQDLVRRVDDIGPKWKVLGKGELHSRATLRG